MYRWCGILAQLRMWIICLCMAQCASTSALAQTLEESMMAHNEAIVDSIVMRWDRDGLIHFIQSGESVDPAMRLLCAIRLGLVEDDSISDQILVTDMPQDQSAYNYLYTLWHSPFANDELNHQCRRILDGYVPLLARAVSRNPGHLLRYFTFGTLTDGAIASEYFQWSRWLLTKMCHEYLSALAQAPLEIQQMHLASDRARTIARLCYTAGNDHESSDVRTMLSNLQLGEAERDQYTPNFHCLFVQDQDSLILISSTENLDMLRSKGVSVVFQERSSAGLVAELVQSYKTSESLDYFVDDLDGDERPEVVVLPRGYGQYRVDIFSFGNTSGSIIPHKVVSVGWFVAPSESDHGFIHGLVKIEHRTSSVVNLLVRHLDDRDNEIIATIGITKDGQWQIEKH